MAIIDRYNIDLLSAIRSSENVEVLLDNAYFEALEQDEIEGGNLTVNMHAKEDTRGIIHINTDIEGYVTVNCDRCLDPLQLDIKAADEIKVTYNEEEALNDAELCLMPERGNKYNVAWDLFEIIITSMPIERVHPNREQCNTDMLQRFTVLDTTSDI